MILMEKVIAEIEFLVGERFESFEELIMQKSFDLFSDETLSFLSDISELLLNSPEIRNFPDVATFAFYCRKANVNLLKSIHSSDKDLRIGKGILFHIAPGNVPVNFAYSLFAGIVTGNINIVRVPTKNFEQVNLIIHAIKTVMKVEKYKSKFSKRLYLVRYDRESSATKMFSKHCDVRIIWGGNKSINEIRKSSIPPKSTEITFSDRYSISILNANNYLESMNKSKIALDFYNDTYLFDQNACTSPQTIYWLGSSNTVLQAQKFFWENLQIILQQKQFNLQPIHAVDKLTTFYSQAISYGDIEKEKYSSNDIWRVKNFSIHNDIDLFRCSNGYFNEVIISSLDDLLPVINRKVQTIGYYGFKKEELNEWILLSKPLGIDRIVPIGRTMDFSLIWDGFNLVYALSRQIQIL